MESGEGERDGDCDIHMHTFIDKYTNKSINKNQSINQILVLKQDFFSWFYNQPGKIQGIIHVTAQMEQDKLFKFNTKVQWIV